MATFEFDQDVFNGFIAEAQEDLAGVEQDILQLESRPTDTALLNAIFRPIHSIKGNSAFFNLSALKQFTHEFEFLLDSLRRGKQPVRPEIISLLLQGADLTQQAIARAAGGEFAEALTPQEAEFLVRLQEAPEAKPPEVQLRDLHGGLTALLEGILSAQVTALEDVGAELRKLVGAVVIEGTAPSAGTSESGSPAVATVTRMRAYITGTDDRPPMSQAHWSAFTDMVAELRLQLGSVLSEQPDLESALARVVDEVQAVVDSPLDPDELLVSVMLERQDALEALVHEYAPAGERPVAAPAASGGGASTPEAAAVPATTQAGERTMRIAEAAVDEFMAFVGELIVTGETFNYLQKRMVDLAVEPALIADFRAANQGFDELSTQLRESLMSVRKMPLRQVMQKVPRIVRDIGTKVGKQVEVTLVGDGLQVDKRIIEKLEAPIMHAARNSIDHGIEAPDVRAAAGKPETGNLRISAEEVEDQLVVRIADDGAGLDPDKLRRAAVRKGLLSETAAADMSDRDARQLIFAPGFSTAEQVTDISGRGVGMDVVRTNLSDIGGRVEVHSECGQGTTVTFTMPLSTALIVINCLITRIGEERYLVPAEFVQTTVHGGEGDLVDVAAQGEVFHCRGGLHPLVRLADYLEIPSDDRVFSDATLVILEHDDRTAALLVDEVLTLQPLVIKEMGEVFQRASAFMGSAVMGDGHIALALDVPNVMVAFARQRTNGKAGPAAEESRAAPGEATASDESGVIFADATAESCEPAGLDIA